jgi:ATP-binding cassette subfamily C exporter for protease/lipase
VELFDGTLAENVARFGVVDHEEVKRVIVQVGLEEMVSQLPDGLNTRIGEDGAVLSGGQRQRVALARAIYGRPKLLVLDEPNSSLDEAGEQALLATLQSLKAQGSSVLLITHRTSVLPQADKLLMIRDGQVAMFGPRDEVLAALQKAQSEGLPAPAQRTQSVQASAQSTSQQSPAPGTNTPNTMPTRAGAVPTFSTVPRSAQPTVTMPTPKAPPSGNPPQTDSSGEAS